MKTIAISVGLLVLMCGLGLAQQTGDQAELDRLYDQIMEYRAVDEDTPANLHDRYFELYYELYPEDLPRDPGGALDQGSDGCENAVMFTQPEVGIDTFFFDAGTTLGRNNDCIWNQCGRGPDVFYKLTMTRQDCVIVSTCGSQFDTKLCIYREDPEVEGSECCNPEYMVYGNDNDGGCGNRLVAQVATCFQPGVYYICLDGAATTAQGSYAFRIDFANNDCITPEPPAECPEIFTEHVESGNEEPCGFVTTVEGCPAGFCGAIDPAGDQDVYKLTAPLCSELLVSLYADDTEGGPGGTGFEEGLDGKLTLYTNACDAPISQNDDIDDGGIAPSWIGADPPEGTDSQMLYISMTPGADYYIVVSGENGSTGLYELVIECLDCINPE